MRWSRDFTALLLRFAGRVSAVGDVDREEALRTWTPFYLNLGGLTRSFDPLAPTWQEFVAGVLDGDDPIEWAHRFYLQHASDLLGPTGACFTWSYEESTRTIRFHFHGNRDTSGHSSISPLRRSIRVCELTALFAEVWEAAPQAQWVRGRSWLYNLPQYCCLFPPQYIRTATPVEPELQFMSLWGQFLDRTGNVRPGSAEMFRKTMATAGTLDTLRQSFPLPVLAPRCSVEAFYRHYALTAPGIWNR